MACLVDFCGVTICVYVLCNSRLISVMKHNDEELRHGKLVHHKHLQGGLISELSAQHAACADDISEDIVWSMFDAQQFSLPD